MDQDLFEALHRDLRLPTFEKFQRLDAGTQFHLLIGGISVTGRTYVLVHLVSVVAHMNEPDANTTSSGSPVGRSVGVDVDRVLID